MGLKNEASGDSIIYVPSSFVIHKFKTEVQNRTVLFQVVKLLDSLLIFINYEDDLHFSNLSLAMQNRYESDPIQSQLMGNMLEYTSKGLASKLTKKLNKTVFLSCNIDYDKLITPAIEKSLFEEIGSNSNAF